MTFRITLDISAPPATIFEFIADFATVPRWYSAVQRVERIPGTDGVGALYDVYRSLPGGAVRNEVAVTSLTDGAEVTFTSVSGPTPFVYRYLVEPVNGVTRLTLEGTISSAGLRGPAAHLGPLAEQLFKRGMRTNLKSLAAILEH